MHAIKLKLFKTNNKCPTLGVKPGNMLLIRERTPLGYDDHIMNISCNVAYDTANITESKKKKKNYNKG